jgi:hypothetical protein
MISGGPQNTSIGSAVEPLIQVAQANFSSQFQLSPQKIVEQFAAGNISCASQNSLVNLNGSTSAVITTNALSGAAAFEVYGVVTITTTITITYTETLQFITQTSMSMVTSTIPTTTISTHTVSPTPTSTGLTAQNLVFGRCVVLAVVQELGVVGAAGVQRLLQSAINSGQTIVNAGSGIKIDLKGETLTGLTNSSVVARWRV